MRVTVDPIRGWVERRLINPHQGWDMDDDETRELIACSLARNAMFQRIEEFVAKLDEHGDERNLFHYPVYWAAVFGGLDWSGFSARRGVRKRPDLHPLFNYRVGLRDGDFMWWGRVYPSPDSWRPTTEQRRRRGLPPARRRRK